MSHGRRLIRNELVRVLIEADTMAGSNVFADRPSKAWAEDAPALYVWTLRENPIEQAADAPRVYARSLEVTIEAHVQRELGYRAADLADDLMAEVELVFERNRCLPGLSGIVHVNSSRSGLLEVACGQGSDTRQVSAASVALFQIVYQSDYAPDPAKLAEFQTARATWDLGPLPDTLVDALDIVSVQENPTT